MAVDIVIVSRDLMTSSQITSAARRAERDYMTLPGLDSLVDRFQEEQPSLIVIDLTTTGRLSGHPLGEPRPGTRVIAFGPHVQDAILRSAEEAGCDLVLTRGQFHSQIDTLLLENSHG